MLDHLFCKNVRTDHFRFEGVRSLQQLFLPYLLAFVNIGINFSAVLNVASNETSIRVDLPYFCLRIQEKLLRICFSKVIVLDGGSVEDVTFLNKEESTFLERVAVNSISFFLEVTEVK